MNYWQKVIKLREQNAELLELLAEALEYLQDPDDFAPYEQIALESKIDDIVNPREA